MDRTDQTKKRAGSRNAHNTFERTRPAPGRGRSSYSRNVSTPKAMQEERQRLILLVALLVVLPPIGVICLWRGGFLRLPYRAAATLGAFLLMILYFSWMLPEKSLGTVTPEIRRPAAVTEYSPSSSMYQQGGENGVN